MKNLIVIFMGFLFLSLNLLAGPARVIRDDLPILKVPARLETADPVVVGRHGVRYCVRNKNIWVVFMAKHDGTLKGFRIVQDDRSVYVWGVVEHDSTVNLVKTNVEAWKRFYEKQVRFNRPVEFSED